MNTVRGLTSALPVYVVLADLWYGLLSNITQSLDEPSRHTPNLLPTVPDVAFNWLQVLANSGMVLVMTFALWQLLQLNKWSMAVLLAVVNTVNYTQQHLLKYNQRAAAMRIYLQHLQTK